MERISSFSVNHDILQRGIYLSRVDGDIITYDIRFKEPNKDDFLSTGEMHTIEHIFATFVRNSQWKDSVIYFGPMGCRTGFYLLLRDTVSYEDGISLIKAGVAFIAGFEDEIPGINKIECGNYLDHDLEGAKKQAALMVPVLKDWKAKDLYYKEA